MAFQQIDRQAAGQQCKNNRCDHFDDEHLSCDLLDPSRQAKPFDEAGKTLTSASLISQWTHQARELGGEG